MSEERSDTIKTFVIADTHFGHENIIKYESRPFKNTEEMNQALIKNWNSVVGEKDIVYFLGDFALCSKEKIIEIGQQLKGYKILIYGNHDKKSVGVFKRAGFDEVYKHPIEIDNIIFSHAKIPYDNLKTNQINIHGHNHSKCGAEPFGYTYKCVSVENINYTPIELSKII
jgi:calcineurin-like phosphoesterase family protein